MKTKKTILKENIQIASKEGVTKNGKPYKVVLLTSDNTNIDQRKKENAIIGAKLKITKADAAKNYPDFRKVFGSLEPPTYQMTSDPSVFGWGYFVNSDQDAATKIDNLKKFKAHVDKEGGFEPGEDKVSGFSDIPSVNDFIKRLQDIKTEVGKAKVSTDVDDQSSSKEDIKKKIEDFINELADEVDSVTLTGKIKKYFDWIAKFPGYSFNNQLLIYIQKPDATRVNSKSGWAKLGYKPKTGATDILVWRPTLIPPTDFEKERRKEEFNTKYVKGGKLTPELKDKMEKFVNSPVAKMPFVLYPVYDISDVVDDKGSAASGIEKPKLDWFSTEENEVADKIFDAMVKVYEDFGIDFGIEDSRHGEKGYSAGGKVRISSDAVGVGKASTAIHEFAHELMHQNYLKTKAETSKSGDNISEKNKHILDAYVGRNLPEILELQAESVAYVVLKSFDIPNLKYAINYIALWKGSRDSILGNLDVITTTANIVIKNINKHLTIDEIDNEPVQGELVSQMDVAKMLNAPIAGVQEEDMNFENPINEIKTMISKFKKIIVENVGKKSYEIYHNSYTSAINAALEYAEMQGYSYDQEEVANQIGLGPKKPSEGQTNRFTITLYKNGVESKKALQIQVYGMREKYELNCYIA